MAYETAGGRLDSTMVMALWRARRLREAGYAARLVCIWRMRRLGKQLRSTIRCTRAMACETAVKRLRSTIRHACYGVRDGWGKRLCSTTVLCVLWRARRWGNGYTARLSMRATACETAGGSGYTAQGARGVRRGKAEGV